jgi:hypothetical protein
MYLMEETIKHIVATQQVTPSLSGVEMWLNHAPDDIEYPLITFNVVSLVPSMAMDDHDYGDYRVQFTVYGNEQMFTNCMTIMQNIESTYHRKSNINLNNGVNLICSKVNGGNISFFNDQEKIWQISEDFRFMVGK